MRQYAVLYCEAQLLGSIPGYAIKRMKPFFVFYLSIYSYIQNTSPKATSNIRNLSGPPRIPDVFPMSV